MTRESMIWRGGEQPSSVNRSLLSRLSFFGQVSQVHRCVRKMRQHIALNLSAEISRHRAVVEPRLEFVILAAWLRNA